MRAGVVGSDPTVVGREHVSFERPSSPAPQHPSASLPSKDWDVCNGVVATGDGQIPLMRKRIAVIKEQARQVIDALDEEDNWLTLLERLVEASDKAVTECLGLSEVPLKPGSKPH